MIMPGRVLASNASCCRGLVLHPIDAGCANDAWVGNRRPAGTLDSPFMSCDSPSIRCLGPSLGAADGVHLMVEEIWSARKCRDCRG